MRSIRRDGRISDATIGSDARVITGSTRFVRVVGILAFFALALILAACSGGEDVVSSSASTTTSVSDTEASSGTGAEPQDVVGEPGGDSEEPDSGGTGEKRAVVVIGDERFEFDMSSACVSIGGAVGGTGFTADGSVRVEIDIPPEDWETSSDGWGAPSIRVRDERDESVERDWEAGGSNIANYEELRDIVRVDSFSTTGVQASGTATFIDLQAYMVAGGSGDSLPEPVTGTFDINCG